MRTYTNKKIAELTFIFTFLLLINISFGAGIGASPATLEFNDLIKGGYSEQAITVSNPNDAPIAVNLGPTGDFASWIFFATEKTEPSLSPTGNITENYSTTFIVDARSSLLIRTVVKPPHDVQTGSYKGTILVTSKSVGVPGVTGTSISVAVLLKVDMEVIGEQILRFTVYSISIRDTEKGIPISLTISGINQGNVRVSPKIRVDIMNRDKTKIIKSREFIGEEVLPTRSTTMDFEIDSDDLEIGQYWANVQVFVDDRLISQDILTFDIMEKGALRSKGNLIEIRNKEQANVGEVVRIEAAFENIGEIIVNAKFKGEVYFSDRNLKENLVKVIESDELNVPIGGVVTLVSFFTPEKRGKYIIRGHVIYSGKITEDVESVLNVSGMGYDWINNLILLLILGTTILAARYSWRKLKKKQEEKYSFKRVSEKYKKSEERLDKIIREGKRLKKRFRKSKYARR